MIGKIFSARGQNRSKKVSSRTVGRVAGCQAASYRRFQYSGTHMIEVLPRPFQRRDSDIEPGELLFYRGDDPLLFYDRRNINMCFRQELIVSAITSGWRKYER